MSERPSAGIGKRLAKYRKLAGLSARELSEKIGGELSRGVIANIESGRKTDVTVDQLIALSWALGVPPAALALPINEPQKFVRMTEDPNHRVMQRAYGLTAWFQNEKALFDPDSVDVELETSAGALAQETIRAVRDYFHFQKTLPILQASSMEGEAFENLVHAYETDVIERERHLRRLGIDLKVFKADE